MTLPVTRVYDTVGRAQSAAAELKKYGFSSGQIHLAAPGGDAQAAIADSGLPAAAAASYAEQVAAGKAVLSVNAPFGRGQLASNILAKYEPTDFKVEPAALAATSTPGATKSRVAPAAATTASAAAPLSAALNWPTLLNDPAPFSNWLKIRTLRPYDSWDEAKKASARAIGAAPFSQWLKMPVLSGDRAPLSKSLNWSLKSDDPAPLSKMLNMPTLSSAAPTKPATPPASKS